MKNNHFEILAPVGNREMLTAAVRSGADAVYLGVQDFNARRNAENFTLDTLSEVVAYCHIRGVKVYLTLNILIGDKEMADAINTAAKAATAGIDAVIAADLGLITEIRRCLPELPVHVSTQATAHSPSALLPLKKLGVKRVVLSRELSKEQIKDICIQARTLGIETEAFVHGALCMSMSGQCLLSAMLGGRSGNRGLCAGPCRLPFKAKGGTGYDLSLKDLSLADHISELKELGINSFKIEGRMKRPEYVAAATSTLRSAVDFGAVPKESADLLKNVFSRSGFTDGYYTGNTGDHMFGIRTKDDVIAAGLSLADIHAIYRTERQSIPLTAEITVRKDESLVLSLCDGINNVTTYGEVPAEAINRPITADVLQKSISKLGGTPYYIENFSCRLDDGLAISAASLNRLRRECVEKLNIARAAIPTITANTFAAKKPAKRDIMPKLYLRLETAAQLPRDFNGVAAISLPLESNIAAIQAVINRIPKDVLKIADVPRGIALETAISERLVLFKELGFTHAACGNLAVIPLAQAAGLRVIADFGLNIYNSYSSEIAAEMGAEITVLSPELLLENAVRLNADESAIIAYGRLPLMLTLNCPLKNGRGCAECGGRGTLTDRLGVEFPVRCRMGFSELLNSRPIWLADRFKEMNGTDYAVLYFTDETPERVAAVLEAYRLGNAPDTAHTRGLYYRGVE